MRHLSDLSYSSLLTSYLYDGSKVIRPSKKFLNAFSKSKTLVNYNNLSYTNGDKLPSVIILYNSSWFMRSSKLILRFLRNSTILLTTLDFSPSIRKLKSPNQNTQSKLSVASDDTSFFLASNLFGSLILLIVVL